VKNNRSFDQQQVLPLIENLVIDRSEVKVKLVAL